jgi:amidohydrolase
MTLLDEARALLDGAIAVRRRIHRHPEIGLDLPQTQAVVLEALKGLPLDVHTGTRATWVTATLDGGHEGPTILLRGDMDALPMPEDTGLDFTSEVDGAMHACGHDTHVAMLLQAARLLVDHRDELEGTVLFMFQPGEEGYHGARLMIEEGLLDNDAPPSAAFALHVVSYLPAGEIHTKPGPLLASSDKIVATVTGQGGHASAPYRARDPVPVACEIVQALQTMVTRKVNVFDPAVVTIASIHAGSTNNVIPELATMEGTVRTLSEDNRGFVLDNIRQVVEGVASAHGMSAELVVDPGYPTTVNDDAMTEFALDVSRDVLGDELVKVMDDPVMGAEDFSYVLQRVPGAMLDLGVAPPGDPDPPANHSNRMMVEEPAMANGIALYAALALRYLGGERAG